MKMVRSRAPIATLLLFGCVVLACVSCAAGATVDPSGGGDADASAFVSSYNFEDAPHVASSDAKPKVSGCRQFKPPNLTKLCGCLIFTIINLKIKS